METSVCCSREWSGEELSAGRFDVIYLTGRRTREVGVGGRERERQRQSERQEEEEAYDRWGWGARERERQSERQEEEEEVYDFCVAKSPQETGRLFQRTGVMILMT